MSSSFAVYLSLLVVLFGILTSLFWPRDGEGVAHGAFALQLIGVILGGAMLCTTIYSDSEVKQSKQQKQAAIEAKIEEASKKEVLLQDEIKKLNQDLEAKGIQLQTVLNRSEEDKKAANEAITKAEETLKAALEGVATVKGPDNDIKIVFQDSVLFEPNDSKIDCAKKETLAKLLGFLAFKLSIEKKGIEITGHTDNSFNGNQTESENYNQKLSEDRAKSVQKYLEDSGIPKSVFIKVFGIGMKQPVGFNEPQNDTVIKEQNVSKEQRDKNRRVEIRLVNVS
jgi:outer membrane protein OmpA-like peptidoglycan-associated protein